LYPESQLRELHKLRARHVKMIPQLLGFACLDLGTDRLLVTLLAPIDRLGT
jgi:hypothetical protein